MVMVRLGMPYLDIIRSTLEALKVPGCLSGEYAMLKEAAHRRYLRWEAAQMESSLAVKRVDTDTMLTYAD